MSFNALKYLDILINAGVPEKQAKAQLQVLESVTDDNLATKHDIELVRKDIKNLELKIENVANKQVSIIWGVMVTGLFIVVALAKLGILSIK